MTKGESYRKGLEKAGCGNFLKFKKNESYRRVAKNKICGTNGRKG